MPATIHDLPPVLLTIPETAKRLHVSVMTVRRLLARGELARVRIGRAVRVTEASVVEFAKRGGHTHAR